MNKPALPSNLFGGLVCIGLCDHCEINDATMIRGKGIYYEEVCGNCRLREVMSRS